MRQRVKRNALLVFGATFERFCDWYLTFSCPKRGPGRARDRSDFVCGSVCSFFCQPLFRAGRWLYKSNFHKKTVKKRVLAPNSVGEADCFRVRNHIRLGELLGARSRLRSSSVVSTLLKLRLRRHLPRGFILV